MLNNVKNTNKCENNYIFPLPIQIYVVSLHHKKQQKLETMKTYKNVTCLNKEDLDHSSLLEAVKEQLQDSYPSLNGKELTIVADLMVRFDEDVTESNGQFSCYSTES